MALRHDLLPALRAVKRRPAVLAVGAVVVVVQVALGFVVGVVVAGASLVAGPLAGALLQPVLLVAAVVVAVPLYAGVYAPVVAEPVGPRATFARAGRAVQRSYGRLLAAVAVGALVAAAVGVLAVALWLVASTGVQYARYATGDPRPPVFVAPLLAGVLALAAGTLLGGLGVRFADVFVLLGDADPRRAWRASLRFARRRPVSLSGYGVVVALLHGGPNLAGGLAGGVAPAAGLSAGVAPAGALVGLATTVAVGSAGLTIALVLTAVYFERTVVPAVGVGTGTAGDDVGSAVDGEWTAADGEWTAADVVRTGNDGERTGDDDVGRSTDDDVRTADDGPRPTRPLGARSARAAVAAAVLVAAVGGAVAVRTADVGVADGAVAGRPVHVPADGGRTPLSGDGRIPFVDDGRVALPSDPVAAYEVAAAPTAGSSHRVVARIRNESDPDGELRVWFRAGVDYDDRQAYVYFVDPEDGGLAGNYFAEGTVATRNGSAGWPDVLARQRGDWTVVAAPGYGLARPSRTFGSYLPEGDDDWTVAARNASTLVLRYEPPPDVHRQFETGFAGMGPNQSADSYAAVVVDRRRGVVRRVVVDVHSRRTGEDYRSVIRYEEVGIADLRRPDAIGSRGLLEWLWDLVYY